MKNNVSVWLEFLAILLVPVACFICIMLQAFNLARPEVDVPIILGALSLALIVFGVKEVLRGVHYGRHGLYFKIREK